MQSILTGLLALFSLALPAADVPRDDRAAEHPTAVLAGDSFRNSSGFDVTVGPPDADGKRPVEIREGGEDGYEDDGYLDGDTYVSTTWGTTWTWMWIPLWTPDGVTWKMVFWDSTGFIVDWWTPLP